MKKLTQEDLDAVVRCLPGKVERVLMWAGPNIAICGGYILSIVTEQAVNDIDLFTSSSGLAEAEASNYARAEGVGISATLNAFTVHTKPKVQFIQRWCYNHPTDVLAQFDFTISQAVVWYDNGWKSACADTYYADVAAKRLVYTHPVRDEEPSGSFLRAMKFQRRGYKLPMKTLAGVTARLVHGIDPESGEKGWEEMIESSLKGARGGHS